MGYGILLLVAGAAVWIAMKCATYANEAKVQLAAMERLKGVVPTEEWSVRVKGQRAPVVFPASNEGDAMRQILIAGIETSAILTLQRVEQPTYAGVPVSPLAAVAAQSKRNGRRRR